MADVAFFLDPLVCGSAWGRLWRGGGYQALYRLPNAKGATPAKPFQVSTSREAGQF